MILNSPYITGSITVTGNANIQGQLTVTGSLSGTATSASYAYTASSAINATSASRAISSSYSATASFSNDFTVLGNLTVFGTQSVQYITSSQLNISDNVITVNVASPGVRFGGLSVFDSGSLSSEATASLFWDSQNNHWVYQRESGSSYTGGMLISGPRNAAGLGNELGTTNCMLLVGQGGDHLTSSMIYHDSTRTCVPNILNVGGVLSGSSATFSSSVTATRLSLNNTGTAARLQVNGVNSEPIAYLYNNSGTAGSVPGIAIEAGTNASDYALSVASSLGTSRLYIRGDGNIGIATTCPTATLQIGDGSANSFLRIRAADGGAIVFNKGADNSAFVGEVQAGLGSCNGLLLYTYSGAERPIIFYTAGTEKMRITGGGNVGIGTNSPQYTTQITSTSANAVTNTLALHNGSNASGTGTGARLLFKLANFESSAETRKYASIEGVSISSFNEDIDLVFRTKTSNADPGERVRIASDGQTRFQNSVILTNGQINSLTSGASGQSMYLNFIGNGAVYAGSSYAVLYAGSDRRIKSDIKDADSTLNKILNLIPRTFKYKERPEFTNYGFIAQELEEVMPELVKTADGITIHNGEEIANQKSIESYGLAWASILVKAIQEQQCTINTLKTCLGIS
jgi:hypothetical protein